MYCDCHIHMALDGSDWKAALARHKTAPDEAFIRATLKNYQALGFDFLRDGGDRWGAGALAAKLAPEYGIRYRTPCFPIYKTGHYGSFIGRGFSTPAEYRALVRAAKAAGAHFIKIMISGLMDFEHYGVLTDEPLAPGEIADMIAGAHDEGFSVMAHANGDSAVRAALAAGVDSIEHGAKPNDEILRLFRERGAFLCTTISPALPYALFDRSVSNASEVEQFNGNVVFEGIIACAKAALAHGIPVVLGNDVGCPWITQYDFWRELFYFHKYTGVSNAFALYTATSRSAELAGIGSETGTVAPGKCADLIVTAANPLEDLRALRHVGMVMARGQLTGHPRFKRRPEVEAQLDRFLTDESGAAAR